ncbi:MAG: PEP-CTERM sorting domain-containing protein [Verrucomicrobiae bacterium]|nr:PEP-CTERM sorting domain-containing protein [Verrucomicrobiae bacterium]
MVFRDIASAYATNVSFTVYRSDPGDVWPATFTTKLRFAGGSEITVDTGAGWGDYHTPITGNLTLSPVSTNTSLEYLFYATQNGESVVRVNGIESIYLISVPEPTVVGMLALPLAGWILVRRRQAR